MFQNSQKQFFRELNQEVERFDDDQPDGEELSLGESYRVSR